MTHDKALDYYINLLEDVKGDPVDIANIVFPAIEMGYLNEIVKAMIIILSVQKNSIKIINHQLDIAENFINKQNKV